MDRAYSTIALKSLDDGERTFSGLATSPEPDRVLDIIEPLGCKYRNPVVLLRAHDHLMPIGDVHFDRPTKSGIAFRARIPAIPEPGPLKDRVDMAWGEIKHGLIKAVSVGFRPLETEVLPTGGIRFVKSEIFELSTVAVPAQALATIDEIKAIDAAVRSGEAADGGRVGPLWGRLQQEGQRGLDRAHKAPRPDTLKGMPAEYRAAFEASLLLRGSVFGMLEYLAGRVEAAERRIDQRGMDYKGVWKPGQYPAGCFVTHAGSCWHTDKATSRQPGEGDWVLAVKRGADGKGIR